MPRGGGNTGSVALHKASQNPVLKGLLPKALQDTADELKLKAKKDGVLTPEEQREEIRRDVKNIDDADNKAGDLYRELVILQHAANRAEPKNKAAADAAVVKAQAAYDAATEKIEEFRRVFREKQRKRVEIERRNMEKMRMFLEAQSKKDEKGGRRRTRKRRHHKRKTHRRR
jgi:hypothetical protein